MTAIVSEYGELQDLIGRVFDEMGGRGTKAELIEHLAASLPRHLGAYLVRGGLSTNVGLFFRKKADGLPAAPEVDERGTHAQLELLDIDEYRYVIDRQMRASRNARQQAQRYAERCQKVHGVGIDVDHPYGIKATGT